MEAVNRNIKYSKVVRNWLILGLVMLIGQVVLGGITRLTGSGLSITSWDIITGVSPPLTELEWLEAFELYKQTPQYEKINSTIERLWRLCSRSFIVVIWLDQCFAN